MKTYTLKVQDIRRETDDTVTICFKQPGLKKIRYRVGQYLTLQFRINGRRYIRPYSFSSAPSIDTTLDVTVKRVKGGIISNYINDNIKVEDVIEVQEPLGDFVLEDDEYAMSFVFWGVGSGITPLFSMIKQLLVTNDKSTIYLIYGNRSASSVIFKEQLKELEKIYTGRFKIWNFYSNEDFFDEAPNVYKGRIHSDFVKKIVANIEVPVRHYICGPSGLKNMIKESLLCLQGNIDNVFSEDFELVRNPEDFKDIVDQEITLNFQGVSNKINVSKGNSILEQALEIGLELPYSCQTGNCSTCKAILKSGKIKMIGLDKERLDLGENEFLLCCSFPLTENVNVEI